MPALNPNHLLDQAVALLAPQMGRAPRQADLRRAISNAYYAIFHTIITKTADIFAGRTQRESARYTLVYRSINHASLRRVCEEVQKHTPQAKYDPYIPKNGFGADLKAVAAAVVDLQEKRHLADYDPLFRVTLLDAMLAIATARTAIKRFESAGSASRKNFLSLLAFAPR